MARPTFPQAQGGTMSQPVVNPWVRRTAIGVLVVGAVVAWRRRDQIQALLGPLFESVDALGPWAPVVLALLYVPACLMFIPNTFVSPGVGFLLGATWGTGTAIAGLTLGHSVNFLLSRFLGRDWFHRRVPVNRRFRAVELACEREGLKIVTLTRLTPVFPSNLMSYFFGVTGVSALSFALGTAIGLLPRTVVYTTVGAAAKSFADASSGEFEDQPLVQWALYVGVAVTAVVVLVIARIARRALNDALERHEAKLTEPLATAAVATPAVATADEAA
jgi:uncharacterized membrane protein YdjX (TVP38/TMEM64 family)